jgi:nitrite reductase/ring-hydroxylating ferredoxin subunit
MSAEEKAEPHRWFRVLDAGQPEAEGVRGVECQGRSLCVVRTGGRLAALDDVCPHQGALLSFGWIDEGLIVCPRHAWAFDPFAGTLAGSTYQELEVFPVEERPDGVYVGFPGVLRDGDP